MSQPLSSQQESDDGVAVAAEREHRILDERARQLARPTASTKLVSEQHELATFFLGAEAFAIETRFVCEIVQQFHITPIPFAPAILKGVTNLRGEILAVFDVSPLTGAATGDSDGNEWVLVVGEDRAEFGIIATSVSDVIRLPRDRLYATPESQTGGDRSLIRGLTTDGCTVLDGRALLADSRFAIDQH